MDTPICSFVRRYAAGNTLRLHMPGHKGQALLGMEALDITEISGADSLYEADGIIRESENHAGQLFGCRTFYSTEGSSQCIRAMLYLAMIHAKQSGRRFRVAAGRNAHKTFLSAAALLDFEVEWLAPNVSDSYLSCRIEAEDLECALDGMEDKPTAVYLTSPDYLGNTVDIAGISAVCRRNDILLLIDNAHGAYLKFLSESKHPIDLGADMCCDSAHKTLPALTGAAYLHMANRVSGTLEEHARNALAMFGSTSPSYLILQSLDAVNGYLDAGYREKLALFLKDIRRVKMALQEHGYVLCGDEPMKITIAAKKYGYRGYELAGLLAEKSIECEFADPDFVVLMVTPETGAEGLKRMTDALTSIAGRDEICDAPPVFRRAERAMSVREAAFSLSERVSVSRCEGKILSAATVGCPPAVPILVCGERIDQFAIECFRYYGIECCMVVKE